MSIALFYGEASSFQNEFDVSRARRLFELAVGPIENSLIGVRKVFIETDQETSALPFPALVQSPAPSKSWNISSDWTPDWLVRHFAISRVPSLAGFASEPSPIETPPRPLLAAGDPAFELGRGQSKCAAMRGR